MFNLHLKLFYLMISILITGSNGLLGQKLVDKLRNRPEIKLIATARGQNRYPHPGGYWYETMDITDEGAIETVFNKHKPQHIIHTAAMTNVDACETDRDGALKQNVEAVEKLVKHANIIGAHFIHLSTDFIFDGLHGPYDEEAEPNPLSFYAETKLLAEEIVKNKANSWAILRTVLVYGVVQDMSRSNIVLWAKKSLEDGKKIQVVDDQFRTPTLAEDLADGCILAAQKNAQGIYNISGNDFMSIFQLVEAVADFWDLDKSLITRTKSEGLSQPAKRPPVTGFILTKAMQELGYSPHSFIEGLKIVDQQLKSGV